MSAWKNFLEFMKQIAPDLIQLGAALFGRHGGDVKAARRDIRSRIAEIESKRAERDRELEEKHRGR